MGEIAMELPSPLAGRGDTRTELGIGELAYREESRSVSIFHSATRQSVGGEPRAEVPVSAIGMLEQEPASLSGVREGDAFVLERHED
jgi:hypothetical protein